MSVDNKHWLSTVVYYTLAILTFAFSAFFIYCLAVKDVVMWAKVIYFIWIGFVIGVTIFDIICTTSGEGKSVSGLIVYILSLLAVAMACILYFMNTGVAGLATEFFNLFISVSLISLFTTGFMIATWVVGENKVEHRTSEIKLEERK